MADVLSFVVVLTNMADVLMHQESGVKTYIKWTYIIVGDVKGSVPEGIPSG